MSEPWEDGFDSWTPRAPATAGETPVEVDRDELLRLARELGARREAEQDSARVELEQLKEALRARAAAVAERERELLELQKQLGKKKGRADPPAQDVEALAARERQVHERLQATEARERELAGRAAALETEAAALERLREELDEAASGRELAAAERERFEERLEQARAAEQELALRRVELEERERALVPATAEPEPEPPTSDGREEELRRLEARLETRERERSLRRRDAAEARQTFGPALAPPSFSEGLASFVRSRSRS